MNILTSWKQRRADRRAERRAKARSDEIDRQLMEERKCRGQQRDILLIGTPGSGAESFAIVKCIKLILDDYANEQLIEYRPFIWKTLLENSRDMVQALRNSEAGNFERANCATKANCDHIMNHRTNTDDPGFLFSPRFVQAVQDLWTEEVTPLLLDRPSTFSLADNAAYFFAEAQRITAEDYVPSLEDIGCVPENHEKGVMESHFKLYGLSVRVLQVHGQQSYRRKWTDPFWGAMSIMFFISLSDYDEPGISHMSQQTRLGESFALFEAVVNSPWFSQTTIILVLTGKNEFRAKLHDVPLNEHFPDYTGGTEADECTTWIVDEFRRLNRPSLRLRYFITEISDVNDIQQVADVIRGMVLENMIFMAFDLI